MKNLFLQRSKRHQEAEIDDAVLTLSEKSAGEIEWPLSRKPQHLLWLLTCLVLLLLGARFFYLNVIEGNHYQEIAENNSLRSLVIPAPRGIIYDRYGKALVENLPSIDAILIPADLPSDSGERSALLGRMRSLLSLDDEAWADMNDRLALGTPFPLKENLSQDEVILLINRRKELSALTLFRTARRHYVLGPTFAHVLGYEGKIKREELTEHPEYLLTDSIGKQGIEKSYESFLRGKHGAQRVEVDALGQVKKALGILPPEPGSDLRLNIDADLQEKTEAALSGWLASHNLKRAVAIALDPRDGSVLSLVSLPSYDNNLFSKGISTVEYRALADDSSFPLFNRAISGTYPPGSTIKPLLATAALSENIIRPETQIESKGGISIGKFFFGDWRVNGFTDIRRAIAVSSDVYFYSIGGGYGGIPGLGMERMKKYESLFGWGKKTEIDLPGEAEGFLPDPAWKKERFGERWYIGDDYHAAIGQGFITTTPLQIVNAISAIANSGTLYAPRLVAEVKNINGTITPNPPKVLEKEIATRETLRIVREGMRQTVTEGTAQSLKDMPVEIAGKTGTAQFGNDEKTHGWFVSFAPYENPRIAMIILVEGQGEEGYNAVPITKDILSWYFSRPE
ncbi:MAG: penicillin-binding protein 2 [Candidatus Moraniibacteriota bacterium]